MVDLMMFSRERIVGFFVFISGAVVMGVEITASRLLAPYFGDTVYVWGSLIAVIMTALAIGYRRGGRKADEYATFIGLSNLVLIAGVFIILIPLSAPFVLEMSGQLGLPSIYEPILPSLVLLTIPTMYLGMVSPYALRLSARELGEVGGVAGNLSSLNTIGSIVGTFMTVFLLVPNFGTRAILTSMGVLLIGVSGLRRGWSYLLGILLLFVILIVPSNIIVGKFVVLGGSNVFRSETPYSSLLVVDDRLSGVRTLYLNNMPHSAMYINCSSSAVYEYTDYFNLAFGYYPNISRVLFIGGGGFSGPKQFLASYPDVMVDVVEIDPVVVDVAYEYFMVPDDERLNVFVMDGRRFLENSGVYDLIVLDAYSKTYVPFHLLTSEFVDVLVDHLSPNGVVVSNVIGSLMGDTSRLSWSIAATMEQEFPFIDFYLTRDVSGSVVQNLCLVASKRNASQASLIDNLEEVGLERCIEYLDNEWMGDAYGEAIVLSDDYAPVEDMLNPVTLTSYDLDNGLKVKAYLNPLGIAGIWVISLMVVYILYTRFNSL